MLMRSESAAGHAAALFTVVIWGTTFVSTKVLLTGFQPLEILLMRFVLGFLALLLVCPKRIKGLSWKQELNFAGAGLCGICLYYLLENIALTYTYASNVGVITSVAPFFTAIAVFLFLKEEEHPKVGFVIGFIVAMAGIILITFNGSRLELNPKGDLLALLAAATWAFYSVFTRKIGAYGYSTLLTTRRIFFYGILFMLPATFVLDFSPNLALLAQPLFMGNFLFLGLGASACCFVSWNFALNILGPLKTSVYIYMIPVITIVFSALILQETITPMAAIGTVLTLAGLILSERKGKTTK